MLKHIIYTTIFLFVFQEVSAQQLPLFTQYRENHGFINPASLNSDYFASGYNLSFGLSARVQWASFGDGPKTQTLKGEYIWDNGDAFGLLMGGYIINDWTDPMGFTGIYGRIAGLTLTDDPELGAFSIGLTGGLVQYRVKTDDLLPLDVEDLSDENQTKIFPDVGFGLFYHKRVESGFLKGDNFYGGVSMPQLLGLDLGFRNDNGDFSIQRIQHVYGLLGWYKYINEDSFVETSAWIKYVADAPINIDINTRYQMSQIFWIGTGISTAGSFHLEAGVLLGENLDWDNNIRIGYGYDYFFNDFGPTFGPSHEINVTYLLDTNGHYY